MIGKDEREKKRKNIAAEIKDIKQQVKDLQNSVQQLKTQKTDATNESLFRLWNNRYDERWNNC